MSRESDLYKDKIEVSLDGRQIFYLFFGGAVIVGLVFVLGVMVGRRVEARGHVERAHVESAVDPLAALDRLEGGNGLSFQGALRGGESTASDVERQIGELSKARAAQPSKSAQAPVAKPPAAKPDAVKPVDDKADDKKVDDKKLVDKKLADKKAEDKKAEDKKVDDKKVDDKKVEDKKVDDKKVDDKKADDKKVADKRADDKKPRFTLQLSSFQDRTEAQAFLDSIKSAGFAAYLTEGAVDGKTFYRVRLGAFRTLEAANDAKVDFEKSARKTAQVMKL